MATQPTINELFGSDSEDEEEQIDAQVSAKTCLALLIRYLQLPDMAQAPCKSPLLSTNTVHGRTLAAESYR